MELKPVESGNIAAIGHDGKDLGVRFKSGGEYRYADVPEDVYKEIVAAKSIGGAFHKKIISGPYKASKIGANA